MWVDTLRNVTAAAGRRPLVVYYEALQVNPKREMRRLFTFAGLPPATKIKAESTSKKLTPEDLRATLLDFGKTAKFFEGAPAGPARPARRHGACGVQDAPFAWQPDGAPRSVQH